MRFAYHFTHSDLNTDPCTISTKTPFVLDDAKHARNKQRKVMLYLLTTACVELLGLYLPVYTFCCIRASVSGLMALLVLWIFH